MSLQKKSEKKNKGREIQLKKTKKKKTVPTFFFQLLSCDKLLRPCVEVYQFKWKISSKSALKRVVMVILHAVWETGMTCLGGSSVCWELSYSLAVVLWGCDLVVSGTEESGWILYQVPEKNVELIVTVAWHRKRLLLKDETKLFFNGHPLQNYQQVSKTY